MLHKTVVKLFITLCVLLFSLANLGCSNINSEGVIYVLEDAYYLGKISYENLLEIAYYHNNGITYPSSIDKNINHKIKKTYLKDLKYDELTYLDNVEIIKYYGEYNQCHVIILDDDFSESNTIVGTYFITNIEFKYLDGKRILVWFNNEICEDDNIKLTYVKKYLTIDYPKATINDVSIEKKLGTYNEAQVLFLTSIYNNHFENTTKETILNYVFEYSNGNSALVYFKNSFYNLKEAYNARILTNDSLNELVKKFPVPSGDGLEINGAPII